MNDTIEHDTGELVPAIQPARNSLETGQIAETLAAAQAEMEPPKKTKTGTIRGTTKTGKTYEYEYKYAPLEEVVRVIREPLGKHGLSWHQALVTRGGEYFVRTYLRHSSGEWMFSDYPVIADRGGPQGFASGVTYARRYGLSLALGIAAEDDDDAAAMQEAVPDERPSTLSGRPVSKAYPAVRPATPRAEINGQESDGLDMDEAPADAEPQLIQIAEEMADKGRAAVKAWFDALGDADKIALDPQLPALKERARKADLARRERSATTLMTEA
jgi:hypothetical protein